MHKLTIGGLAIVAAFAATGIGYRLGAGSWPDPQAWVLKQASPAMAMNSKALKPNSERKVLYWRAPDGSPQFAAAAIEAPTGQAYIAVYDDEEPDFPLNEAAKKKKAAANKSGPRKLLYYRNPMGLPDTSPIPKKDWMGMDYIAVYEGEEKEGSTVKVSLDKVQRSGVRTVPAVMRKLDRPIRAPGVAKVDERTLSSFTLRADGFIEKLYVNETGQHIKAGDPLFRVYSPMMVAAQVDYRVSVRSGDRGRQGLSGAEQKLKNLDLPATVLKQLRIDPNPIMSIEWPAPIGGVVMRKNVVEGMMMKAGEELFRIADLTNIWIIADVPEQDIGQIRIGAKAKISFRAFPGEIFRGRVTFVLSELQMATRTAKVRIEVKNPDFRIKPEMFADVDISGGDNEPNRLVVPLSALLDSGNRQVVIVARDKGRFDPRAVKVGVRGGGFVEITEGVKAGEQVVVAANFLIDAESNLKAALSSFNAEPAKPDAAPVSEPKQ